MLRKVQILRRIPSGAPAPLRMFTILTLHVLAVIRLGTLSNGQTQWAT